MADEPAPFDRARFVARLREATPARIGLARAGVSVGTRDHLAFQLAHAFARDAVHDALDAGALLDALRARSLDAISVASRAADRTAYLARPDLGRRLAGAAQGRDIVFVIADGLSARAVAAHALPVLDRVLLLLKTQGRTVAPIVVVEQGRVAIGDEIGALLDARIACVLIGERPGLSSPDSLGIYLTWAPKIGRTDAERNCLSNIRAAGLSYDEAAHRCAWLIGEAVKRNVTGVALKDESRERLLPPS